MNKIYIGKIVTTHGIKGEVRIKSDFDFKEKAFAIGSHIIIDDKSYEIKSYRRHKNFEMITLDDFNNINDVLFLMKKDVYKERDELKLSDTEILDDDLLKYKVVTVDGDCGIIKEIFMASPTNKILRVDFSAKEILIPINSPVVKKIDSHKRKILVEFIEGM